MAALHTRQFLLGDKIFAEHDLADCAYVIESGEVEIHTTVDGLSRCVAIIGPGSLLGEMGILDNTPRSATAVARSDALLTVIERNQLASRLQSSDPVVRLVVDVLLNRLRSQLHHSASSSLHAQPSDFSENERASVIERIKLENELKAGLGAGEMQLYAQPIANLRSRKIEGFETLVRWSHPTRGMVRPDQFIQVAEESGLIVPLGRWILREACLAALRFEKEANTCNVQGTQCFVSVNVSTGQFEDPEFIPVLANILQETGVDPRRIKLEITESVLTDADAAKRWIDTVKSLGVRVALDDFGTGYSSLSYLHEFALDTLKIDQSFVRRMLQDPRSEKIVAAIITIAQALDFDIIAEGVETEDHFNKMQEMGADYAQGYLIARPTHIPTFFQST
jgi:EAL domain-containing protein (putative c-di-GMP-specific phosphodiesterase class I)